MAKNKGKGRNKYRRRANDEKRELTYKQDGEEYAQVDRMLGDGRFVATSINGIKHVCHIPGKMHNKVRIAAGDIVLLSLRGYKEDKEDVIIKYMPDEVRLLKANGELPENIRLNDVLGEEDEGAGDDYIVFEDEDIDRI